MSGILYRKGNGAWISPTDSGYASEDQLQALILEFPELLPGVSADSFVFVLFILKCHNAGTLLL